jgi:hypothetical protein
MAMKLREKLRSKRRSLIQGAAITLLAAAVSAMIGTSRIGAELSAISLDLLIRSDSPIHEDRILLVDITEQDYNEVFHRKRPLDPPTVFALIRAAHTGGAKLIAVDITTEDWPIDQPIDIPAGARVVWAQDFYLTQGKRQSAYTVQPLLGGNPRAEGQCYGLPSLGEEAGVVRWFDSGVQIESKLEPSFTDQIVHRSRNDYCLKEGEGERRIISFRAEIQKETASTLLKEGQQDSWGRSKTYEDKIIIIGGSFHSGADVHDTPVGTLNGLEIIGQTVSSALRGTARAELGEWTSTFIDLSIGLALIFSGLLGHRVQLWATLMAAALTVFLGLYLYRQYYLALSFLPILAGILSHRYLEKHFEPAGHSIPEKHDLQPASNVPEAPATKLPATADRP